MIPLVDMHCHLLAGLDDGPRREADAIAMCQLACAEGVTAVVALAHQKGRWASVTADRIRSVAHGLSQALRANGIALSIYPGAQVMVHPEIEASWRQGEILGIADKRQYLLLEMPHDVCVDLQSVLPAL